MKKHLLKFLLTFSLALFTVGWVNGQTQGDILITEIMANPAEVGDSDGEYFELYNTTSSAIDIDGWTILDDGSDSHTITTVNGTTVIPAYGFLVLGQGDGTYNSRDYELPSNWYLSNSGDEVVLETTGAVEICRVDYTSSTSGTSSELNDIANHTNGVTLFTSYISATDALGTDKGSPGSEGNTAGIAGNDNVAPNWTSTYPKVDNISSTAADLLVNIDEPGTAYYVVLADGASAPSVAQVKAGEDASGTPVTLSSSIAVAAGTTDYTENITGLSINTAYDLYVVAEDDEGTPNVQASVTPIDFTTLSVKSEPTNHVTGFTATANTYSNISIAWTDAADGTQAPDAYLIKASTGAITAPSDGTDPAEDTDLSDGDAIVKVLNDGTQFYAFDGLIAGTTYNFQIWSYTNEGTSIDFKLSGPTDNATTETTELFFSEYIEGDYTTKVVALEIYNPTLSPVNLSNYKILGSYNGGGWADNNSYVLPNVNLAAGDVYIITRDDALQAIQDEADLLITNGSGAGESYVMGFSGDDARALAVTNDGGTNWEIVDIIGVDDTDPGSGWDVAGTSNGTYDHTLVRKIGRTYGNTDWTSSAGTTEGNSEWIVLPKDNINNLGTYRDVERDTTLATLTVDAGTLTPVFDADVTEYTVELPYGTTAVPTVSATVSGTYASEVTVQATNVDGTEGERTATVTVTGDDSGTKVYSVVFSVALNNDATLSNLTVSEGTLVPTFDAGTEDYAVELPYGTSATPTTTATENDPNANAVVTDATDVTSTTAADRTTTIVVTAEDGSTTKTYTIVFSIAPNDDATLSDLTTDMGTLVPAFDAATVDYTVELPYGTTTEPVVGATENDPNANAVINQITDIEGDEAARTATVVVTAEDGSTTKTYTIVYSLAAPSTDATLSALTTDMGTLVPTFDSATEDYTVELPYGTTTEPVVDATENDPNANAVINQVSDIEGDEAARTATVVVTAEDGTTTKTYTIVYSLAAPSTDATLSALTTDMGTLVPAFDAATEDYTVELPYGTTTEPVVDATENDPNANAVITQVSNIEGDEAARTATVVVTAEDGSTTKTYTIVYTVAANDAKDLTSFSFETLSVDGVISETDSTISATVPFGTDVTALVATFITTGAEVKVGTTTQTSGTTPNDFTNPVEYIVVAADASERIYTVTVSIEAPNTDATLSSLSVSSGTLVPAFDAATEEYTVTLPYGTTDEPTVSATATDGNANVDITQATDVQGTLAERTATIVVTAEDGSTTKTYTIVFDDEDNDDATLSALTVDNGTLVPAFDAATEDYTVTLPYGTTDEPTVSATASDANANVDITQATDVQGTLAERTATIVVTAEDGSTTKTYTVVFDDEDNNDATLSSLTVDNGTLVPAFDAATYTYNVTLPEGTSTVPTVDATPTDANANAVVTQATNVDGTEAERTAEVLVTAEDGSTELTYSVIFALEQEKDLFFSEYIEGSSNNKALEIYNPTNATIDLTTYIIRGTGNEATDWEYDYPFPAGSTVAAGDVFVIVDDGAIQDMQDLADWIDDGFTCGFNGNDSRGLFKIEGTDTTLIDIIGDYNNPSGADYSVAGVDGALAEHTILRKTGKTVGNTDWTSSAGTNDTDSEWIIKDQDYIADLGSYGPKSGTDILTYSFAEQTGPADIDDVNHTVDIEVAFGTSVTALVAEFTLSDGATAKVGATDQVSGTTPNDFSSAVTYTITAEDGSTQDWVVTVTVATTQSDAKEVTSFTVEGIIGTATIESAAATVDATVEYATDITSLKPTFEISALATISDTTATKDFTNAQTYTVTAEDGTEKVWTVTITKETPSEVSIYDIQYTTETSGDSPEDGNLVKTSGIVTAAYSSGYFIQDEGAAWHGLFINDYDNEPSVGDSVEVVGEVGEYQDHTELTDIAGYAVLNTGLDVFDPIVISTADAALEDYEGVLVSVTEAECTVEPNQYNVWTVDDGSGAVNVDDNIYGYIPTLEAVYDVTGIMHGWYGTVLLPRSASDINTYPVIGDITIDPTTPTSAEDVTLSVTITDAETDAQNITAQLFYGSAQGSEDTEVTGFAYSGSDDIFEGTIPASSDDVYYKVVVTDASATVTSTGNYSVTVTGISNPDGMVSMNIFPNPSNGLFTLEMNASKAGTFNVQIVNIQGQVVYSNEINQDGFYKDQIDISNEAIGIYYIRITDGKNMKVSKIMIQ